MRKKDRMRPRTGALACGKMHDLSQIARLDAKNARLTMTESLGRFGRIAPIEGDSQGSVTGKEAD